MAQNATADGYDVLETETHRGETMHKVQTADGDEGWVFTEDL